MTEYSGVRPVSPLKKNEWSPFRTLKEDHAVVLRERGPRPEKCCDGVAVIASSLPGSVNGPTNRAP